MAYSPELPVKTQAPKKPESVPVRPENAEMFENFYEALLLNASRINEGAEGVVATVNLKELPEEFLKFLVGTDRLQDTYAIKMLKIYRDGKGLEEFQMQTKAYEALQEARLAGQQVAQVPRPYNYREVNVKSPELKDHLAKMDPKHFQDIDRVQMFVMELIDGDDIATLINKAVVRKHPKSERFRAVVDSMDSLSIQQEVGAVLKYQRPGGKAKDEFLKANEEDAVNEGNYNELKKWLGDSGFKLSPEIRKQLAPALRVLHKAGLFHRDLHLRNVMQAKDGSVYIIDFGKALDTSKEVVKADVEDIYRLNELKQFITDESILDTLETLEKLERSKTDDEKLQAMLADHRDRKGKRWTQFQEGLKPYRKSGQSLSFAGARDLITELSENDLLDLDVIKSKVIAFQEINGVNSSLAQELLEETVNEYAPPVKKKPATQKVSQEKRLLDLARKLLSQSTGEKPPKKNKRLCVG